MSGLSLAAGPVGGKKSSSGRRMGMEEEEEVDEGGLVRGLMGSLRTIELQLVAFIVVFSASGLVPILDLLFPLLLTAYILALARFVFPAPPSHGRRQVFHGSRMFQLYVALGTVLGLFLPLAYVLGAFARGDQAAVRAATPHLFLLSVQILSENIISRLGLFSPPVRVILTLIYTARRLFALYAWVLLAFASPPPPPPPPHDHLPPPHLHHDLPPHEEFPVHPPHLDHHHHHHHNTLKVMWMGFGRWLAIANLIYFSINTFCFLIPRFLPRAFERYLIDKKAGFPSGDNQASNAKQQEEIESEHTPFQGKVKVPSPSKQVKESSRKELEEKKSA